MPAGGRPTAGEGRTRLEHLPLHGPTPFAFTFGKPFTPRGTLATHLHGSRTTAAAIYPQGAT
ncbi:MAG: DUF3291 domain-containing protein [Candidatus Competibacterales bacterium]